MAKYRYIYLLIFLSISISLKAQMSRVNMLFVGDAMQHESQIKDALKEDGNYNYSKYFEHVTNIIKEADIATINLEVTLAGKPYTGYPAFSAPDEYAKAIVDAGFNVILTANNHSADKRKKGIERTVDVLNGLDVLHTGTFKDSLERNIYYPLMLLENGIRIAMLNYTYGTNGIPVAAPNIVNMIDTLEIKRDIEAAKNMEADLIIANMHWGEEYVLKQNRSQERLANFLVDNGVRLVIGNHPHVVQPVDIRKEGDSIKSIIVYSLGNFISGMRTVNTSGGMMARIAVSKDPGQAVSIDHFDYSLVWTHKPKQNGKYTDFRLLNVSDYENETGKAKLGEKDYMELETFAKNARQAIESLWDK